MSGLLTPATTACTIASRVSSGVLDMMNFDMTTVHLLEYVQPRKPSNRACHRAVVDCSACPPRCCRPNVPQHRIGPRLLHRAHRKPGRRVRTLSVSLTPKPSLRLYAAALP